MPNLYREVLYEGSFSVANNLNFTLRSGKTVKIHPFELVIPIALGPSDGDDEQSLLMFPAKIDTGFNHNLALAYRHLASADWANQSLDRFGLASNEQFTFRIADGSERDFWTYDADLWIVGNQKKDPAPYEVNLNGGFVVYQEHHPDEYDSAGAYIGPPPGEVAKPPLGPRLPLIGNRALHKAGVFLDVDYTKRKFCLYTPSDP
jgi:hypothetical protein